MEFFKYHKAKGTIARTQSFSHKKERHDFVVILHKTTGAMRFTYLMIDNDRRALCAKPNLVTWPRLIDWVDFKACVLKNCIYVVGGREKSTGKYLNQMLKYDPDTKRWMEMEGMQKPRIGHSVTALNGKIYVFGGACGHNDLTVTCESYEPMIDEWQLEEDMPGARRDHRCIVKDSSIYLSGGASPTQNSNDNMWVYQRQILTPPGTPPLGIYDSKGYQPPTVVYHWKQLEDRGQTKMSHKLSKHMMAKCENKIYFFGGLCDTAVSEERFGFGFRREVQEKRMISSSSNIESYECNVKIIKPILKPHLSFVPQKDANTKKVFRRGEMRNQNRLKVERSFRSRHIKNKNAEEKPTEVRETKAVWEKELPTMLRPRCCSGTVVLGDKIFVIGGHKVEDEEHASINDVIYYHTTQNSWHTAFSLGFGQFQDVECCVINVPRTNVDFKTTEYSDCRWVLW